MAPRRLNRRWPVLGAAALALTLLPLPGSAVPTNDPGPFWPLVVGHEGEPYADALPSGATYTRVTGRLPNGLRLDPGGAVSGRPLERGRFAAVLRAREPGGPTYPVRIEVVVRRPDESDLPARAPSFAAPGPRGVTATELTVDVTSSFDGRSFRTPVRLYRPDGVAGPTPLVLFHRGRGFDYDDYDALFGHVASYGIAVASVQDELSFTGRSFRGLDRDYDLFRPELGMESASGVMESVVDALLARAADPQDRLFRAFDSDLLFYAGHSRGGGAAHASHERSFLLRMRGLIYLMPFDLRYFSECAPPGVAPAYPIFDATPRTPSLVIAAENDGDLTYPIADQLIDRATGPTTQVTLYGGVHNLISDSAPAEGSARISRASEQRQTADWIVCFVKRWAEGDADLDRRLYAGGDQGSQAAAVTGWYPAARTVLVEDAQDADDDRNRLGRNLVANLRRSERSYYPGVGDIGSLRLRHTHLTPTSDASVWRMATDAPLDIGRYARLVLRVAQTGPRGWSGLGLWVRLVDGQGGAAWGQLYQPSRGGRLPDYDGLSPHQRLQDVHLDLDDLFDAQGGGLDRTAVRAVDVILVVRDASRVDGAVVDQVRFE